MTNGLTGGKHFKFLPHIIKQVFDKFTEKMKVSYDKKETVDLRREIIKMFESTITMFLLERDISNDQIMQNVIKADGSIVKESLPFFDALNNAAAAGVNSAFSKGIFGERPVTKTLTASIENWANLTDFVD